MTSQHERDFKGVWIPKEVWLNTSLTLMEKLFLVEIDSLDNDVFGGCIASNKYFAQFFDITRGRCTQIIKSLELKKLINIEIERDGKQITRRRIRVVNKLNRVVNKLNLGGEFSKLGLLENDEDNNTSISNPFYKGGPKKNKKFIPPNRDEVIAYMQEHGLDQKTATQTATEFMNYHMAPGWVLKGGRKMRDWKAASRTWLSNKKKFEARR